MAKISVEFKTPEGFLELAEACCENLPAVISADVEIGFFGDDWEFSVNKIRAADGSDLDQTWLDEYAGYAYSLREQITLLAQNQNVGNV